MSVCKIHDCNRVARSNKADYCEMHYYRIRRNGTVDLKAEKRAKWITEYFNKPLVSFGDECIEWPYSKDSYGYGGQVKFGEKYIRAHRAVCIVFHGEPDSPHMEVAHSCGNGHRSCVNPKHLRWATKEENIEDRKKHGVMVRGEMHPQAILSAEQVMEIFNDQRKTVVIARDYGVSRGAICSIKRGKNWCHITGAA